jgi:ATP-dependent DNA helicase RecG
MGGIKEKTAEKLTRLGISTIQDLLLHYPFRHEDFSRVTPIGSLQLGAKTTIRARVYGVSAGLTRVRRMRLTEATLSDGTGQLRAIWFNQPWVAKALQGITEIFLAGTVEFDRGPVMKNPLYERVSGDPRHAGRLVPIYHETAGLTSRWLREKIQAVLPAAEQLPEFLPDAVRRRHGFPARSEAVQAIHFPASPQNLERARARLAFDEMFVVQVAALQAKRARQREAGYAIPFDQAAARAFVAALPFRLTTAQRRAAWQILQDMERPMPMNRLLEGDVGSGKTVVAAMAMHHATVAGYQSVLLAPTEILARQHAEVVEHLLRPFGVTVGLLLGSTAASQRERLLEALAAGSIAIVVGTHALIDEAVRFHRLGLVVVDEQHRFGVEQRLALRAKGGRPPHFLSMTATPIPRTLGLTLYGDLDISAIDELPVGRHKVETRLYQPGERAEAYAFVRGQVAAGRQVFVICPIIQESDKLGVRSATAELEKLRTDVFPELAERIGLIHGRLKPAEREAVMGRVQRGEVDILVATSVVEVGIDIPNASVMLIEGAERFGLAQLHQFRGRVGRGAHAAYCLLFTDVDDPENLKRLQAVLTHTSGFELAEIDLRLRGMGELYGERQHGFDLKVADLFDVQLIRQAQEEAERVLESDPLLAREPALRRQLTSYRRVFALD